MQIFLQISLRSPVVKVHNRNIRGIVAVEGYSDFDRLRDDSSGIHLTNCCKSKVDLSF